MSRLNLIAVSVLLLCPHGLSSQVITGHVREVATDLPIAEAVITILDAANQRVALTLSDSAGAFTLDGPARDSVRLRVERMGYAPTESVALRLSGQNLLQLEIHLRPEPITLETLTANATPVRFDQNLRGFARRMQSGFGRYLGPAELSSGRVSTAMDVLSQVAGSSLLWDSTGRLLYARTIGTGYSPGNSGYCTPRVFVDGSMIQETVDASTAFGDLAKMLLVPVDYYVRASEIRAVEFYRRPRQAPPQYQAPFSAETRAGGRVGSGECPIVLIWTDWGFGWERR